MDKAVTTKVTMTIKIVMQQEYFPIFMQRKKRLLDGTSKVK